MLRECCAEGLRGRHPEVRGRQERRRRSARRRETAVHFEPLAVLAQHLGEHRRVTVAEVVEVEAFGVERIRHGSADVAPLCRRRITRAAALARVPRVRQRGAAVGLACMRWPLLGTEHGLLFHNGGTGGFRTFVGFVPATYTAVVVLSNPRAPWTRSASESSSGSTASNCQLPKSPDAASGADVALKDGHAGLTVDEGAAALRLRHKQRLSFGPRHARSGLGFLMRSSRETAD